VCDLETSRMGAPYIYIYIYIYDISRLRVNLLSYTISKFPGTRLPYKTINGLTLCITNDF